MTSDSRVRVDKWLWAARFFKTRSLASDAVVGGKVEVNGDHAKPARGVAVGDMITIRIPPYEFIVEVRALGERRGPASVARTLYAETEASTAARSRLAEQLRIGNVGIVYEGKGRPTKRDRRKLDGLR